MGEDPRQPRPRSPSAIKIEKWGLVEGWLSTGPGRMIVLTSGPKGLQVHAIDKTLGEQVETVQQDEDISSAALRAVHYFDQF